MFFHVSRRVLITSTQGTLLFVLCLAALYVTIGRIFFSGIDQYQTDIEELITDALNVPVSTTSMEGSWSYFDPKLIVRGVKIGDQESPAIQLDQVVIELDMLTSLRRRVPAISTMELVGLRIGVQRDDAGKWFIPGMPRSSEPFDPGPIFDSISNISAMKLDDVSIDVTGRHSHFVVSSIADQPLLLRIDDGIRTLSWSLLLNYSIEHSTQNAQFNLMGQYQGIPGEDDYWANLYLQLPRVELTEFLPPIELGEYKLSNLDIRGDYWFDVKGLDIAIRGNSTVDTVGIENDQNQLELIGDAGIIFAARGNPNYGGEITIESFEATVMEEQASISGVSLAYETDEAQFEIAANIPGLSVEKIASILTNMGNQLSLEPVVDAVNTLDPRGEIREILIHHASEGGNTNLKVTGLLDGVQINAFKGVPAFSNLDGFFSLTPQQGFVDVHNDDPFILNFKRGFSQPWPFDSAHTRLNYSVGSNDIKLNTGLIELVKGEVIARGRVFLNFPPDIPDHNWGMEVGVIKMELLDAHRYLPKALSPELKAWLMESVLGGVSDEAAIIMHGSLAAITPKEQKAHEIFLKVKDTILDYSPDWPRVDDLEATVYAGNTEVFSDDATGVLLDSRVVNASVLVPINKAAEVDTVLIDGKLVGTIADGIRLLTETPLLELTNNMAEGWIGSGEMRGNAKLNVPLGTRSNEDTHVDVHVMLNDSDIYMPVFDLNVNGFNGTFDYESNTGLASSGFTANLFGKAVEGNAETVGSGESGHIELRFNGTVDVNSLYQWSDQPLLTRASGIMSYKASLNVPFGDKNKDTVFVEATSQMEGVDIDLPSPMGKSSEESTAFFYRHTILDHGYLIELSQTDQVNASLKMLDDAISGGRIHFGDSPMGAVTFDRMKVTGAISNVNYEEWERLSEDLDARSSVSLQTELVETLESITVDVGALDTFGFVLDDVKTRVTRGLDAWDYQLQNQMLSGVVTVPDQDDLPLGINLDFIRFDDDSGENADPLEDIDPSELIAADFQITSLIVDGEDYGSWAFNYRPSSFGGIFESLDANVRGLRIEGENQAFWQASEGSHRSGFKGTVRIPDLALALENWGLASSIEGENFRFISDVSWPGTPAMVALELLTGDIRLREGKGLFVQADSNVGALKLLGIFDFASLGKRFTLDFSDVVDKGFKFDKIKGSTRFKEGMVDVTEPIVIEGASSIFKVGGHVDLSDRSLDNDMIVTLPFNRNLPWYAAYSAIAVGPLTGVGVFIAQKIFQNQIDAISSAKYKITGTIDEPNIEFVAIFDDSVRDAAEDADDVPTGE